MRAPASEEGDRGFTLVELLVVIILIGILAAIAVPVFLNQRKRAYDTSIKQDLRQAAVEMTAAMLETPGTRVQADVVTITTGKNNVILGITTYNGTSFCLEGYNTKATGDSWDNAFWYDSAGPGLISKAGTLEASGPPARAPSTARTSWRPTPSSAASSRTDRVATGARGRR